MRIKLYLRFAVPISLLLVLLVAAILVVVEQREIRALYAFEEAQARTIAESLAVMNRRSLMIWDYTTVQENIDARVDDRLLYIVIYDRNGTPRAFTEAVRDRTELYCCSRVRGDATPATAIVDSREVRLRGEARSVLEMEIPIFAADSPDTPTRWGSLKIGRSIDHLRSERTRIRLLLVALGLVGVGLGVAASVMLAKRVTRPVKRLVEGTVRIARGDFGRRIEAGSRDEIGDLARHFNAMTDDLLQARERMEAANRRLVQAEKLASIGRLSATIAHEIRNPLTSVKLNIQKVGETEALGENEREHIAICREGITQIEKFIKELLDFTRASRLQPERFSLAQIMDESLKLLQEGLRQKGVAVERAYADGAAAGLVDGDKLRQVFLNLLRNAQEAVEPGGRIRIEIDEVAEERRRLHRVRISDDGCGIPEKDRETIFEPFFTTKASGFGLGLANARKIVEQHRGTIRAAAAPGRGSLFEILLPAEETA